MPIENYPLLDDVVAPDTQSPGAHVVDFELQKLLSQGWQRYLGLVRDTAGTIPDPAVREITTTFEGECHGGDRLHRGVRAVQRTRRSWTLDVRLWAVESDRLVARARVILLGIDRSTGRATEIPDNLWNAVEQFEGRTIEPLRPAED
jgi:acyl-CoA thioesterase FadM